MNRKGPRIVLLLLGVNAVLLLLPLGAIAVWRLYDQYLLRQTERQLIAQSVVIAEAYRQAYFATDRDSIPNPRPPERLAERYVAVEPLIDVGTEIGPHEELERLPLAPVGDTRATRAGAEVEPLLKRAQIFNLSGIRILDATGCVVATTGGQRGRCLSPLAEVQRALSGHYASKARHRMPANPLPPLGDIRRRGKLRVFTALPVFSNGEVIAVVAASRTGLDALSSLWQLRRSLVSSVALVLLLVTGISVLFARAIARPMQLITQKAQAIARGEPQAPFVAQGFTPAEIRTLGQALDVMTERLQQRARYVAEFAATVSHELKSPISAIQGAVELLLDWDSMNRDQRERFLQNVDQDAKRMDKLVTRLLSLAKIENAEDPVAPALDPASCCRHALSRYGDEVALIVEPTVPPTVDMTEDHLLAVLRNLVDNALRHNRPDRGRVEVRLRAERSRLIVGVRDYGEGIKPANWSKVGTRFFTTERDRGGTGLGLSIVRAIAERRGGKLEFTSSSEGTEFYAYL